MATVREYDEATLGTLLALVRDPSWIERIVETFNVDRTSVRRSVSLSLTLPKLRFDEKTALLVPVTQVQRDVLVDNLDVEDASGRSLPVLSRIETHQLYGVLIEAAFNTAFALREGVVEEQRRDEPGDFERLLMTRAKASLSRIPVVPQEEATRIFRALFSDEKWADTEPVFARIHDNANLRALAAFFSSNTIKIAELRGVVPGERLVLKYSYDAYYENTESKTLSRVFGQRPYTFHIPTPLAFVAPSYHVRMRAPDSHYCAGQRFDVRLSTLDDPSSRPPQRRPPKAKFVPWTAAYETSHDQGLPYAHLYVNDAIALERENVYTWLQFFEFPPGQQGVAFGFAALATVLFAAIGATFGRVVHHVEGGALFLAVVGAAAVWMRPTFDSQRLLQAPLSAKVGLVLTGALGLLAALDLVLCSSLQTSGNGLSAGRAAMLALGAVALTVTVDLGRRVWKKQRMGPI